MKSALFAAAAALALCTALPAVAEPAPAASASAPKLGTWGFDLAGRQPTVKPGADFNAYANGVYLQNLAIPGDRTRFGNFNVLTDLSEEQVAAILRESAADKAASGERAKLAVLFNSFMDQAAIDKLDAAPLQPALAAIRAAASREQLATLMGKANYGYNDSVFGLSIYDDAKAPEKYAVYLGQSGLGLPDRDYYLEPRFAAEKVKYQAYVAQMLREAGWPEPEARAAEVVAFETKIAQVSWTRAERRDDDKTYNPMTVAQLQAAAPGFPWKPYLASAGLGAVDRLVVGENTAVPKIAAIYAATPVNTLQAWSAFHTVDSAAPYLSSRFVDARFNFRNKELQGQPEQRPRWKRAVAHAQGALGEAVGRIYVERHFPAESKAKMDTLVADLKTAMGARLQRLTWMSPATKQRAMEKLSKFTVKIGYPEEWRSYEALQVKPGDAYGNQERGIGFEWARDVARLNQPVDDREWGMTPQTVNAYYSSTKNEIVFPAAILQAPFFDPNADAAVNYGGIGGVIGHEIIHGFDDQGRKSDGDGVLRDWWTAEDAAKFKVQSDRLGAQYSAYEPVPGSKVNGDLTMGENIADLGGLTLALEAYELSLKGKPAPVLDGVTGQQRVFLGWAQVWRAKTRDNALREQVVSDPHSPEQFRVNGPVRNIDAWYTAFNVKPGDALYLPPEQRVRIW